PPLYSLSLRDALPIWAHRDRSDGCGVDLAVRDGLPRRPAVRRLPQATAGGAEVVLERTCVTAGDGDRATATVRSDVAPLERRERSEEHTSELQSRENL